MIQIITPLEKIQQTKQSVNDFVNEIPTIIFEAAKKAADMVRDRTEGQGLATNGSFLTTPSNNPMGRYGQRHGKARQKAGLSTSKVDLYFTGQMWGEWTEEQNGNETGVGFRGQEAQDKAQANEDLYDTQIFVPSEQEIAEVKRFIGDLIKEKLKT